MDGEEKALLITPELDRVIRRYVDGILFAGINKTEKVPTGVARIRGKHLTPEERLAIIAEAREQFLAGRKFKDVVAELAVKYNRNGVNGITNLLYQVRVTPSAIQKVEDKLEGV